MKSSKSLWVFLAVVLGVGMIGALAAPDAWYASLQKPSFNPPNWVFAPVWTALYAAMAVAAWRVYRVRGFDVSLRMWSVQLALNGIWSPLFFGWHSLTMALVDIVALLVAVIVTLVLFMRRDRVAGWLLVPYAMWVSFATLLTVSIWRLNPH